MAEPKNIPKQTQLEDDLMAEEKKYQDQVHEIHQSLVKTHTKLEYMFSTVEKRRLLQLQTIAFFAQQAVDDILNLTVLPRLGIKPSFEVRVLYDISLGKFSVWVPDLTKKREVEVDQKPEEKV